MKLAHLGYVVSALVSVAVGCAGEAPGGSGTLQRDGAFPVKAVYFSVKMIPPDPSGRWGEVPVAHVRMFGAPIRCDRAGGTPPELADAGVVEIEMSNYPIAPGTHPLGPPGMYPSTGFAQVLAPGGLWFTQGELQIGHVTSDRLTGSFDTASPDAGSAPHLAGSFDAVLCDF